MIFATRLRFGRALAALALLAAPLPALAQPPQATPAPAPARDGQHDFDFNIGVWKTHILRRAHPLAGSAEMVAASGTVTVRKVWGGRASLEEIEADGPGGHWEGMTLFLYNPAARQWSQTFFNSQTVDPTTQGLVGGFRDGRGELFASDTLNGRAILVRGVWSSITPDSHRYEESYSADGGRTWEAEFTADLTRARAPPAPSQPTPPSPAPGRRDGAHDMDFDLGTWKTHSSRLLHPLTGSEDWVDMEGATVVAPLWGGRGDLAEFRGEGPAGTVELIALRLYNPATGQWYLNFATPGVGALGVPGIGELRDGRLEFYDREEFNGRQILLRFSIWGITADTAQSEQAFSPDGGKTWEVNWINRYTRVKDPAHPPED